MQHGYPVVPGLVVNSGVWRQFLETQDGLEPAYAALRVDNPRQLQAEARRLRQLLADATLPLEWLATLSQGIKQLQVPTVIFRPSVHVKSLSGEAYHPMLSDTVAGLWQSYVSFTDNDAIARTLKLAWAELFRARSLFFWQRRGISIAQINWAVLVQPIQNAIASGVLRANRIWSIQGTWGLGMSLVKGEVIPDYWEVEASTGSILVQVPGQKSIAYHLVSDHDSPTSMSTVPEKSGCYAARKIAKTYDAFRTHGENPEGIAKTSPLQSYTVSEELIATNSLDQTYLQQLIALATRIAADFSPRFTLEWTVQASLAPGNDPQLVLTQTIPRRETGENREKDDAVLPPSSPRPQLMDNPKSPTLVLRGLAAAAGRAIAPATVLSHPGEPVGSRSAAPAVSGTILVVRAITTDYLPLLKQAAGAIAERGGLTSHGAIVARELGIPAILGASNATQVISTGTRLLMDGNKGEVYQVEAFDVSGELDVPRTDVYGCATLRDGMHRKNPEDIAKTQGTSSEHYSGDIEDSFVPVPQASTVGHLHFPYPIATQLLVNLSQPSSLERAKDLPVDGVGLLRSELMAPEVLENKHPKWWLQQGRGAELIDQWVEILRKFAATFAPRPVFYRSFDLRSDSDRNELGLRGTLSYQLYPTLFDLELAALARLHQEGLTNVNLILPFVRRVEEFSFCRRRVETFAFRSLQLWIMAEVPSILFLLPEYVKAGVQGIAIGTNDLTQLLLGVDRDLGPLASNLNASHPAVMGAIEQLITMARQAGIPCSICSQAPAMYPELIDALVRWGITSISVDINAVDRTRQAISRGEQRLLLSAARRNFS